MILMMTFKSVANSTPKRQKIRQRNLSGYWIYTDSAMKSKLDEQIAKLFFSCNLAFNIADNFIFRETIYMLRPGYNPSNRKDISGPLLDQAYDKPLHK